ncbi:lipoprotein LprG [Herbihabitans rhizosphaerae]|uniref:Lipoprotein LprG n=1 Tax=Herbihabitans rhizosphaerae TaxID=1872711 RepID=A0A4Q7L4K9_9PSEU|nr:LppX_LprAFG lipoprotein [Herbihabitans rhizosphaerae]RZS44136.1 lipoprotein LprG [Herbihabitans rhizosphaerae]
MIQRRILLGVLALTAGVLAGCDSEPDTSGPLPDGAALLRDAAEATRGMSSAHFKLQVNGKIPGVTVQNAEGDLNREGGAKGKAKVDFGGSLIEAEFVLVDKKLYLKGPTGDFQELPASMGASIYDPSVILNPDQGIAKVLASITSPKTEAREKVMGIDTYRVSGKVTKDVVSPLVPGITTDVDIKFWLREDGKHQPVRAWFQLPPERDGAGASMVEMELSDVDKPVTVTPPA